MSHSSEETCTIPCNLCGNQHIAVLANTSRSGQALRTVICNACGLVWSDPLPHDPRSFYTDDYRLAYKGTFTPKPKHILRAGKVALSRHAMISNYLTQPKKILDVGSGGGEFAYLLTTLGHEVVGIEPNKGYADYSIKEYALNVQNGFIQDINQADNSFTLITIWHVLEHTENPSAVMQKLHNLLQPDGILVVEVPSVEATCQSPKSTFHEAHIFNFNLATLIKLGEKIGFKALEHITSPNGGNITVFFQKTSNVNAASTESLHIAGNAKKITNIVARHTVLGHYLTITPYIRFINKLVKTVNEYLAISGFTNGKTLLDKLYQSAKNTT